MLKKIMLALFLAVALAGTFVVVSTNVAIANGDRK